MWPFNIRRRVITNIKRTMWFSKPFLHCDIFMHQTATT